MNNSTTNLPAILLLHGALGSAASFEKIVLLLSERFQTFTFDFSGHGKDNYNGLLSMDLFAEDILRYMDTNGLDTTAIFGYSMGGYAALHLAEKFPRRMSSIITLGTKWEWNPTLAARETSMLNADTLLEKVPRFASALEQIHTGQGWKPLLQRTAELLTSLGEEGGFSAERAARVSIPVSILLGADDKMVSRDESELMAAALPNGSFRLLPGVPHPIERVNPEVIAKEIVALAVSN